MHSVNMQPNKIDLEPLMDLLHYHNSYRKRSSTRSYNARSVIIEKVLYLNLMLHAADAYTINHIQHFSTCRFIVTETSDVF